MQKEQWSTLSTFLSPRGAALARVLCLLTLSLTLTSCSVRPPTIIREAVQLSAHITEQRDTGTPVLEVQVHNASGLPLHHPNDRYTHVLYLFDGARPVNPEGWGEVTMGIGHPAGTLDRFTLGDGALFMLAVEMAQSQGALPHDYSGATFATGVTYVADEPAFYAQYPLTAISPNASQVSAVLVYLEPRTKQSWIQVQTIRLK